MKRLQPLFSITGLMLCTVLLGGADGCTINIGDGDGDGDGDDAGDGDGDGDGDSGDGDGDGDPTECYADSDCAEGQYCALADCAALCEPNADGLCDPVDCGPGTCQEHDPGPCAAVDCAPGYHCEVETVCWGDGVDEYRPDGDCDPAFGNCGGGCEDHAICVADDTPVECYSDYDCAPGQRCEYASGGAAPCYDENGDGECDNDGFWQEPGRCVDDVNPPACAYIDCGPGYVCEELTTCYPCDCVDEDCGACDDSCFTEPTCVPVGNEECYYLDVDTCSQAPGCHVELVYPPCAQPEPDPNDPSDPAPPPSECEPVEMCVPDYTNPGEGSCAGHCGSVGSNEQCFCDAVCMQYGDCCADFVEFCEEVIPPSCTSDADCGDGYTCELREYCFDDFGMTECYVEGLCMPLPPPDPCNDVPLDVCEEVVGCTLIDVGAPCYDDPNGFMCDPAPAQMCVTAYEEPPTCQSDADCGEGGICELYEVCLDWCDQSVPDPECCYTEGRCSEGGGGEVCAQVETPATDPMTGHCEVFPTPCDVPDGWIEGC